jgi:class 3 adenylate cyclase
MTETIVYAVPPPGAAPARELVALGGPYDGRRFRFHDQMGIGRLEPDGVPAPGLLLVADPTVSSRHCVITQDVLGRCFVRDTSRNGTRVDSHRLVPGVEVELKPGQVLSVGQGLELRLEEAASRTSAPDPAVRLTVPLPTETTATVLVGDIRRYTTLVREAPPDLLQTSLGALFHELQRFVAEHDGTVKEYPGDAIFAYWEASPSENCAVRACRAALALREAARRLADAPSVWRIPDHALQMEWALATGSVMIDSLGGARPVGLSMIGEPVVRAFRLEKIADDETGDIVVCSATHSMAQEMFHFRALGAKNLEGFAHPEEVFALTEAR